MQFKSYLSAHRDAAVQCKSNVLLATSGQKQILSSVDFSLIFGFVFRSRPGRRKPAGAAAFSSDIDRLGNWIFQLFEQQGAAMPSQTVLTLPTICELTIAVLHHADHIKVHMSKLRTNIARYDDFMFRLEQQLDDPLGRTGTLEHEFEELLDCVATPIQSSQLSSFIELIKQRRICGLGDFIDGKRLKPKLAEIRRTSELIAQLYERYRPLREGEANDLAKLRNRIDGLNWSITSTFHELNKEQKLVFVTPLRQDIYRSTMQGTFDRAWNLPQTLYMNLRALEATSGFSGERTTNCVAWLSVQEERLRSCIRLMGSAESVDEISDMAKLEIQQVYRAFDQDVYGPRTSPTTSGKDVQRQAIESTLDKVGSRASLEELLGHQHANAQQAANAIIDLQPRFHSDELLHDLGLKDEPQIKSLLKRLR